MMQLRDHWSYRTGIAVLVLGALPLLVFGVVYNLGFLPDPNPNPIGLGLLFVVSMPIAAIFLLYAYINAYLKLRRDRKLR